jgi:hypothetical protein
MALLQQLASAIALAGILFGSLLCQPAKADRENKAVGPDDTLIQTIKIYWVPDWIQYSTAMTADRISAHYFGAAFVPSRNTVEIDRIMAAIRSLKPIGACPAAHLDVRRLVEVEFKDGRPPFRVAVNQVLAPCVEIEGRNFRVEPTFRDFLSHEFSFMN